MLSLFGFLIAKAISRCFEETDSVFCIHVIKQDYLEKRDSKHPSRGGGGEER